MFNFSASSSQPSSAVLPSDHQEWSNWEGKLLELGLAELDLTSSDLVERLVARLPWKKLENVQEYYKDLVMQMELIELGLFDTIIQERRIFATDQLVGPEPTEEDADQIALPSIDEMIQMQQAVMEDGQLPPYLVHDSPNLSIQNNNNNNHYIYYNNNNINLNNDNDNNNYKIVGQSSNFINCMTMMDHGRARGTLPQVATPQSMKGKSWSEEEHRLFLMGMNVYGKGDWKNISKNFVTTRTSTQVASHAQKYFKHMEKQNKTKRRPSIYDIRTITAPIRSGTKEQFKSIYDMVDFIRPPVHNISQNINQSIDSQAPGSHIPMGSTNAVQGGAPTLNLQGAGGSTSYHGSAGVSALYQGEGAGAGAGAGAGSSTSHQGAGLVSSARPSTLYQVGSASHQGSAFPAFHQGATPSISYQRASASIPYYGTAATLGGGNKSSSSAAVADPLQQLTSPFLLPETSANMSDLIEEVVAAGNSLGSPSNQQ